MRSVRASGTRGCCVSDRQCVQQAPSALRHLALHGVAASSPVHRRGGRVGQKSWSDTCNGAECIGGADHLMLATRAAARVYMETVFLNYYTWPSCSRWTHREPFRCDIDGPAKALGFEGLTSGLLMSHGIGICKTGLMRHSVRSRSASGMRSMEAWIRSLSHHRPSLPLRPLGNRNHSDKTPLCFSGLAR